MSSRSLWLKEPHDALPRSRFEGRAEVAVIGGGVTGCSCALTLAVRGVRVRLYEATEIAAARVAATAASRCGAPRSPTTRHGATSAMSARVS